MLAKQNTGGNAVKFSQGANEFFFNRFQPITTPAFAISIKWDVLGFRLLAAIEVVCGFKVHNVFNLHVEC
jgi:hypothetical protein